MTKNEVAKMMRDATDAELAKAKEEYETALAEPNAPFAKRELRACKREYLRLISKSRAMQDEKHSPFKG